MPGLRGLAGFPGAWRWVRRHVLRGPGDAALTLLALAILLGLGLPLLRWVAFGAEWGVIGANRHLLLVGSYPVEQVWRVWLVLMAVLALSGLSAGRLGVASLPKRCLGRLVPAWVFWVS